MFTNSIIMWSEMSLEQKTSFSCFFFFLVSRIYVLMFMCLPAFVFMYHVCTWCLRVLDSLELDLWVALCYHLETRNPNLCPFFTFSFNFKICMLCACGGGQGSRQVELVTEPRTSPMLNHLLYH